MRKINNKKNILMWLAELIIPALWCVVGIMMWKCIMDIRADASIECTHIRIIVFLVVLCASGIFHVFLSAVLLYFGLSDTPFFYFALEACRSEFGSNLIGALCSFPGFAIFLGWMSSDMRLLVYSNWLLLVGGLSLFSFCVVASILYGDCDMGN